jgi:hypothetical protein
MEAEQLRQMQLARQRYWRKLFQTTIDMSEAELRAALKSRSPDRRFVAAYVVGERMLEWQSDLIPLLEDSHDQVRLAARRALVILSFLALNPAEAVKIRRPQRDQVAMPLEKLNAPVDFGPRPAAPKPERVEAAQRWTQWWAERGYRPAEQERVLSTAPRKITVEGSNPERLALALIQDDAEGRKQALALCRDGKGGWYTEALALAIARQSGEERQQLRDALAMRMARMTDKTLGEYLEDENAEIRRAAVIGLTMRESTTHMDQMIEMLRDPQPTVSRAAYAALCRLSGQDFGPALQSTEADKIMAALRWRKWWEEKHPHGG